MTNQTELIKKRYDRIAPYFDKIEGMMEKMMLGELRDIFWQQVTGEQILEAGVGTGKNFPYYPAKAIAAIDFSPVMIQQAEKKRKTLNIPVDLSVMDVQQLDFPDNHFDTVLAPSYFVPCPIHNKGY